MHGDRMVRPDVGVAAMADTRWQLKQEIGVLAPLPHGPQLVSNDTAYATIPTLPLQCNRLDPFHVTGPMAFRRTGASLSSV